MISLEQLVSMSNCVTGQTCVSWMRVAPRGRWRDHWLTTPLTLCSLGWRVFWELPLSGHMWRTGTDIICVLWLHTLAEMYFRMVHVKSSVCVTRKSAISEVATPFAISYWVSSTVSGKSDTYDVSRVGITPVFRWLVVILSNVKNSFYFKISTPPTGLVRKRSQVRGQPPPRILTSVSIMTTNHMKTGCTANFRNVVSNMVYLRLWTISNIITYWYHGWRSTVRDL